MSENFSVCFFIVLSYLVIYCWKDVLCSSDIMWLVKFFHSEKKNFPMRRFCTVNNNQLIHDICILLFRYPSICILFHELEVDSQVNYLSIFSLTTYSVCTVSCELRGSKISSRACITPFSVVTFFSTPLLTREKNPDCRLPAASTYWEPCVSILLYRITLWVTVFEK